MKRILQIATVIWLGVACAQAGLLLDYAGYENGVAVTDDVAATFTVEPGDVIAVVGAGNNNILPNDAAALSAAGITFAYGYLGSGGPRTTYWYGTATTSGSLDILYTTADSGNLALGIYHLRSDTGNPIVLLDTVSDGTTDSDSMTVTYDFSGVPEQGVYLEAAASYSVFQNLPVLDANKGDSDKFVALHGGFTNSTGFTSTYSLAAAGVTYNLMSKTNLLDAFWTTNQTDLTGSPVAVSQMEDQEFYQVHVAN